MADKTTKTFTPISTEISKYGVVSLATRPNQPSSYGVGDLSATDLKKRFDYLANQIISEYNKLIELFNSDEILGYLKAHSGSLKSALEQITNTNGDLITKNPADQKGENEVLNDRILAFYNAIVELQAFTEVKDDKHKDKTLSKVYETIANVNLFKEEVKKDKEENAKAHNALTDLITALQDFLGLNEHEGDSPLDGVIKDHISDHNDPESLAHGDIRQSVKDAQDLANEYADGVVSDHNGAADSHTDIRQGVTNAESNAKGYADGILLEHDANANAHAKIRETISNLSDNFTTHQTASDAHKDVIDATLKSANDYTDEELKKYIPLSEKGASNGVATLSSDGKVPAAQLPSFVDDVLEYADFSKFPTPGEEGKIYVDLDTDKTYRWGGSKYVEISESLAIGTTEGTAFSGKAGNDHVNNFDNPHKVTKSQVGLGNVVNTGDSATPTQNGTTKFTTGGAYAMKTDLEGKINNKVEKSGNKVLSDNNFTDADKNKLDGINLSNYVQKDGNKVLSDNNFTDADKNKLDGIPEGGGSVDLSGYATKQYVDDAIADIELPEGGASIDEKHVEIGDQVTAKGDYSAAFNKGIIGSEAVFETEYYGQTITVSLKDAFTKGVSVEAIDVVENTIDVYGTCKVSVWGASISLDLAYAFSQISGERFNFVIEISAGNIKAYYPAIEVKEVETNNKTCARLTIHKSCSVSGISTSDKVTNIYGGFAYEDGSMTVNSRNIAWGESSFSSGTGNVSIAPNSHTQNISNIASGDAGSASGSFTEAGVTAFSTGHKTKALGESSFTFGIRSETAYTESTEKEGGKGSVAGGYNTRANAPYTAVFGVDTVSNAQGQLVCGLKNKEDANALFIVGQGNSKNAFSVDKIGKGSILNLKVGNDAAEVTGGNGTLGVGNRTKTRGESSVTFGIGSETAETTYGDNAVDGGKGAIAGGYEAKANARYSQAFGVSTHSDREGQLVCGLANATDTNALFIVGQGDSTNALAVKTNGDGYFKGNIYTNGVKVATLNDIPDIPDIPENNCPISEGAGAGAAVMGDRTTAYANYSLAGGETSTTATGAKACLAFGISAEAQKNGSVAFGWRTKANCENQLVVGRCNNYENWGNALFVVGNGTSDTDRRNALVIHSNGTAYVTGDIYSNNNKIATESYCAAFFNTIKFLKLKGLDADGEYREEIVAEAKSSTTPLGGRYEFDIDITIPELVANKEPFVSGMNPFVKVSRAKDESGNYRDIYVKSASQIYDLMVIGSGRKYTVSGNAANANATVTAYVTFTVSVPYT